MKSAIFAISVLAVVAAGLRAEPTGIETGREPDDTACLCRFREAHFQALWEPGWTEDAVVKGAALREWIRYFVFPPMTQNSCKLNCSDFCENQEGRLAAQLQAYLDRLEDDIENEDIEDDVEAANKWLADRNLIVIESARDPLEIGQGVNASHECFPPGVEPSDQKLWVDKILKELKRLAGLPNGQTEAALTWSDFPD